MSRIAFSPSPASSSFKRGQSACFPSPVLPFHLFLSSPLLLFPQQKFLKFLFAKNMQIRLNYLEFLSFCCSRRESHPRIFLNVIYLQSLYNLVLKPRCVKFIINFVSSLMLGSPRVAIFILNRIFYSYD